MELKYDIYTLNNAQGTGEKRQYVRIVQHEPMTEKQLQEKIQNRCSLTKGDVAAVLAELHDLLVEEFSMGRRFYIPEIGYFSMSASLEMPEENPDKKITGKEVRITGINFRPEEKLMKEVQRNVHFRPLPLFQPIYKILRGKDVGENQGVSSKESLHHHSHHAHPLRLDSIHGSEVAHSFLREGYHGEGRNSPCAYLFSKVTKAAYSILLSP